MCLISVTNLKEINLGEDWLKAFVFNWCEEEGKCKEYVIFKNANNLAKYICTYLLFFKFAI